MPNVASLWGAGAEWMPSDTEGADSEWLADDWADGLTGRPHVYVSIAGQLVNGFGDDSVSLQSGSWSLGRNDWFDVLTPGSASLTFFGIVEAATGDEVVISTEGGVLWVGDVDGRTEAQDVSGTFVTTISAVDIIGRLGKAINPVTIATIPGVGEWELFDFSGMTAEDVANDLLSTYAGWDSAVVIGDSDGTLPTLIDWYEPPDVTLLEVLNNVERTSNAMMALQPDGSIILVMRDSLVAASVEVIDLSGIDAPYSWVESTNASNVINHWVLTNPPYDPDIILDESDATSVALYGDRAYSVDHYICATATHFKAGLKAAMAVERPVVTGASFHIHDLTQRVLYLAPLAWISQGGDTWQVMSIRHDFGGSSWDMTLTADVSQNAMMGIDEPTPDDPPTIITSTENLTSSKSTTVVKRGSTFMGNGAGDRLPVGRYKYSGDIYVHRACIGFTTYAIPANFVRVKKATLTLTVGVESSAWISYGSSPRFYVRRITESWTEGTFDDVVGSQYSASNATIWPGPNSTQSGQSEKACGNTDDLVVTVDVTDAVDAAYRSGTFHGLKLISVNEDYAARRIEFWSDDAADSDKRPKLKIVSEVSA